MQIVQKDKQLKEKDAALEGSETRMLNFESQLMQLTKNMERVLLQLATEKQDGKVAEGSPTSSERDSSGTWVRERERDCGETISAK